MKNFGMRPFPNELYGQQNNGGIAPPDAPATCTAAVLTPTSVQVDWDAVTGSTGYRVYCDGVAVASATTTTYTTEESYEQDAAYTYSVKAYNVGGESAATEADPVTPNPSPIPEAPATVSVIVDLPTQVTITAEESVGATSYKFYRDGGLLVTQAERIYQATYEYEVDVAYTFSVKACSLSGCSSATEAAPCTPNPA